MSTLSRPRSSLLFALLLATTACGAGIEGQGESIPSTDSQTPLRSEADRLRIEGSVDVFDYGSVMDFFVMSGELQRMDAKVTFDGMPVEYDPTRGSYNLVEFLGSVFHSGRSAEVCASWGGESLCRTLTAPGLSSIVAPLSEEVLSRDLPYLVFWEAATGASRYDVSVVASDSRLLDYVSTNDVSFRFPPRYYTGIATISVAAVAVMPGSDTLGDLSVKRVSQVSVIFEP